MYRGRFPQTASGSFRKARQIRGRWTRVRGLVGKPAICKAIFFSSFSIVTSFLLVEVKENLSRGSPSNVQVISHRLRPGCRRTKRPSSSGLKTPSSLSAIAFYRNVWVGSLLPAFFLPAAHTWMAVYAALSKCVFPVPFSPTTRLSPSAN